MTLSYKEVAEILRIIDESNCEELVLDIAGAKLVVRRWRSGADVPARDGSEGEGRGKTEVPDNAQPMRDPPALAHPEDEGTGASPSRVGALARADDAVEVRAPMVGTFFRRPSPQEPPFVEVGAEVAAGDPLCLIEVMKLYTTIEAPCAGRVVEIVPEDATLVEHGAVLFRIEPA